MVASSQFKLVKEQDDFDLDLSVLWVTLKSKGLKILILSTICFFILAIPILFIYKEKYTSEAYVFMDKTSTPSISDMALIFAEDKGDLKTNPFKSQLSLLSSDSLMEAIYDKLKAEKSPLLEDLKLHDSGSLKQFLSAEQVRDTDFIKLKSSAVEPKLAYELSKYYLSVYETKANDIYTKPIAQKRAIIEDKIVATQNAIQAKSDQLNLFQEQSNTVNPEIETTHGATSLSELKNTIDETEASIVEKKSMAAQLKRQLNLDTKSAISSVAMGEDEVYTALVKDKAAAEKEYEARKHQYTDQHPYMMLLKEKVRTIKQQLQTEQRNIVHGSAGFRIRDSVRSDLVLRLAQSESEYESLLDKQVANRKLYDSLQSDLNGLPIKQLTYNQLSAEVKTLQEILAQLNKSLATLKVQEATSRIYIYSDSKLPEKKDFPTTLQLLLIVFTCLFLLIYFFSVVRQFIRDTSEVRLLHDLQRVDIPIFEKFKASLNTVQERQSYDTFAYRLNHYRQKNDLKTLLVSDEEDVRKSAYCLQNIALSLGKLGHKILILDLNYEISALRFDLASTLNLEDSKAYTDLAGKGYTLSALKKYVADNTYAINGYENIFFFDLFKIEQPVFEFYNSKGFEQLLGYLKETGYDWVLASAPTLVSRSELLAVSSHFDGLVVNTELIKNADKLRTRLAALDDLGCPISGILVRQEVA